MEEDARKKIHSHILQLYTGKQNKEVVQTLENWIFTLSRENVFTSLHSNGGITTALVIYGLEKEPR